MCTQCELITFLERLSLRLPVRLHSFIDGESQGALETLALKEAGDFVRLAAVALVNVTVGVAAA